MIMEKEFFTELKKNCIIHGIDIDILCDEGWEVCAVDGNKYLLKRKIY